MTMIPDDPHLRIDESELAAALAATPGLDLGPDGRLAPRPPNTLRNDRSRRLLYHWTSRDSIRYHLVAGPRSADEFEKTRAFHQAYPSLGVRPVALLRASGLDVAVLEHVEGQTLEKALASGALSLHDAQTLVDQTLDTLDAAAQPAEPEAALHELDALREDLLAVPALGPLDLLFFDQIVFPFLRTSLPGGSWTRRWTTGDFVARNLLLDAKGHLRLIDSEFAAPSVLASADAFRFGEFSNVPDELKSHVRRRLPGQAAWWSIHFCVDQLRKLAAVRPPDAFPFDAEDLLARLLRETRAAETLPAASCLFRSRTHYDELALHSRDLQTQYDELQAQFGHLQSHAGDLQSRYDALAAHAQELQTQYDALLAHSNTLQGHYESLAAHAHNLETARDSLSSRLSRTPRPARWFIPE